MLAVVTEFLQSGSIVPDINNTFIALIPKMKNALKLTDFRLISLCNVLYKIIAKLLSNRLKLWISQYIRTISYLVLVNSVPSDPVIPSRGLRPDENRLLQDPLSPLLFVICIEALSNRFHQLEVSGNMEDIPFGGGNIRDSHLFFADDCLLFYRATLEAWEYVRSVLTKYEEILGQKLNVEKMSFFFSKHTSDGVKDLLKATIGVQEIKAYEKYLRLRIVIGRSKTESLLFMVDMVRDRTQNWKNRFLSYAGREALIKSILQAIPTYSM
ncbi:uncharacterized protein LOC120003560 [Tripterygium wilfordii]|uniref:uncharacterized protein LOC120003560 n=1 Tax=Tripterygium wilfordii TaxID=458696 RepID=UPI0018F809DB|nr:uncharacterized protein LOC120003560 [Tripterygium wilfordii]